MSEHEEQVLVMARATMLVNYRGVQPLRLLHASLNGATMPAKMIKGRRVSVAAEKQKSAGMKAGLPDLSLPVPCGEYHGLYIEMKASSGRVDPKQLLWLQVMAHLQYCCCICYTADTAISDDLLSGAILDYLLSRTERLFPATINVYKPGKEVAHLPVPDIDAAFWEQWDEKMSPVMFRI